MSKQYESPLVLQTARICLEGDLMFGSITLIPVETAGHAVDEFVDYSFTSDADFNHTWGE